MGMLSGLMRKRPFEDTVDSIHPPTPQGNGMRFAYGNGDQPLSGYTIKRGVGIGGFGEVYFATNEAGKEVAIKRIQRNLEVEIRGVRQCLNLRHPNLIGIYDIRFDDSQQGWIVMEYIAGKSLRDRMDDFPDGMPAEEALDIFGQMAAGVAYLHDHGIVHRDLKPANVFIDGGLIKIGDYGLSKFISSSRRGGQTESVGTFHYMAPEIGKGEYGKEIDVYAMGIILYELLTGNVPFDGESSQEIILKHLTADPDVSVLPIPYADVVRKALAKNPANRFRDIREMLEPLGMRLEPNGMVSRSSVPPIPVSKVPPRVQPVLFQSTEQPKVLNQADIVFGPVKHQAKKGAANAFRPEPMEATVRYREPIARSLQSGWLGFQRWYSQIPENTPWKAVVLVGLVLLVIFNAGLIISAIVMGLMLYVPYYIIWYIVSGSSSSSSTTPVIQPLASSPEAPPIAVRPVAAVQPAAKPAKPRPITFRQWQSAQRHRLMAKPALTKTTELTSGLLASTGCVATLSVLGGLITMANNSMSSPGLMSGAVWTAVMTLIMAWSVLFLSKRWESQEEDRAVFRFKQMAFGILIGAIAYALGQHLVVPWSSIHQPHIIQSTLPKWNGFYDEAGEPMLPAYVAHFAAVMGLVRWWRQADIVRKNRFSFAAVIGALIGEAIVQAIVPISQPWGLILVGATAVTTQISANWINSAKRESEMSSQVTA